MRQIEFLIEVTAMVDYSEVDSEKKMVLKEKEIRRAIENLDCSVAIFTVESVQKP